MVPVRVGLALITTLPVPVMALLTKALLPLVKTACEAVAELNTGAAVNVATPVCSDVPVTVMSPSKTGESFKYISWSRHAELPMAAVTSSPAVQFLGVVHAAGI